MLEGLSLLWTWKTDDGFTFTENRYTDLQLEENSSRLFKRVCQYEKTETREASWSDLRKIAISYPIGYFTKNEKKYPYIGYRRFDEDEKFKAGVKFYGYFPLAGFVAGGYQIGNATSTIFNRVITDDNKFETTTVENRWHGFYSKKTITKLELSLLQKTAIVMLCLAAYVRGIVTFCQLGIVFAPFDLAANLIARGFKKS